MVHVGHVARRLSSVRSLQAKKSRVATPRKLDSLECGVGSANRYLSR